MFSFQPRRLKKAREVEAKRMKAYCENEKYPGRCKTTKDVMEVPVRGQPGLSKDKVEKNYENFHPRFFVLKDFMKNYGERKRLGRPDGFSEIEKLFQELKKRADE